MRDHLKPHQWRPGQSGNPGGRPKLPEDIKEARLLNKIELVRILNEFLILTAEEIDGVLKDSKSTSLERIIASIIKNAVERGDQMRLSFLLEQLLGKVKDQVELSGPDGKAIEIRSRMSEMNYQERIVAGEAALKLLKDQNQSSEGE